MDEGRPTAAVTRYFRRLFDERDLSACDELLAPDFLDHDAPAAAPPGPSETRAYVAALLERNPELKVVVHATVELGQHVAVHASWDGRGGSDGIWHQDGLLIIAVDSLGRLVERRSTYR